MLVNDFEVDMVGKNRSVNWKKKTKQNMAPEQKLFPEFNLDVLGKRMKAKCV